VKMKTRIILFPGLSALCLAALLCCTPGQALEPARAGGQQSEEYVNSLGMKFRLIQPGSFVMGSDDADAWPWEKPAHAVTLTNAYYIGVHEVTQAQFEAATGFNPSHFKGSDLPVDSVKYTEAEWEYACRAGTRSRYYWGDGTEEADRYEWHAGNSAGRTHPVGSKEPNPWGLHDMAGNVEEYCRDYCTNAPYPAEPQVDPTGPEEHSGMDCTMRGGDWCHSLNEIGFSFRRHGYSRDDDERNSFFGFRVILEIEQATASAD